MTLPRYAFFQGQVVPYAEARVGVLTHALNYGTAVFGGLRGYYSAAQDQLYVFRPEDHVRRFLQSTRLLRMELPYDQASLLSAILALLRAEGLRQDCYVRPLAFYGDELIGVRLHDLRPFLSIVAQPFGAYLPREEGAHVCVSSWTRVDDNVIPARGKIAGAYVNSALAKSDAVRAGFDDAILLNPDGHVCEASAANVLVVRDGVALTPPVTDNILEGVTRRTVLALLRDELGVPVQERSIDRSELYLADEVLLVGTGVQVAAVTRVDHRPIGAGKIGPVAQALRELFFRVVRGEVERYRPWLLPVYEK